MLLLNTHRSIPPVRRRAMTSTNAWAFHSLRTDLERIQPVPASAAADVGVPGYVERGDDGIPTRTVEGFEQGLCECCESKDCGCACCCAFTFCAPCIWREAYRLVGLDVTLAAVARGVANYNDNNAWKLGASLLGGVSRTKLTHVLFGLMGRRGACEGFCLNSFCLCCAQIQEVDAVLRYAEQNRGTDLRYSCCGWEFFNATTQSAQVTPFITRSEAAAILEGGSERPVSESQGGIAYLYAF